MQKKIMMDDAIKENTGTNKFDVITTALKSSINNFQIQICHDEKLKQYFVLIARLLDHLEKAHSSELLALKKNNEIMSLKLRQLLDENQRSRKEPTEKVLKLVLNSENKCNKLNSVSPKSNVDKDTLKNFLFPLHSIIKPKFNKN